MAPSGGCKGVGVVLLAEVLAAALTGATLGIRASSFSETTGGPPKASQFFIAIDPNHSSDGAFPAGIADLVEAIRFQYGVHFPGDGRRAKRLKAQKVGVAVNSATVATLERRVC